MKQIKLEKGTLITLYKKNEYNGTLSIDNIEPHIVGDNTLPKTDFKAVLSHQLVSKNPTSVFYRDGSYYINEDALITNNRNNYRKVKDYFLTHLVSSLQNACNAKYENDDYEYGVCKSKESNSIWKISNAKFKKTKYPMQRVCSEWFYDGRITLDGPLAPEYFEFQVKDSIIKSGIKLIVENEQFIIRNTKEADDLINVLVDKYFSNKVN